ncbi:hypothetical protein T3H00_00930 [Pseudomonas fluorescens]|jgi:hypothetical protein|uniref:hypothetical protein n=1 Tax=Pseudomonas fluorescens TaxID=294 RepID=UPI002ACA6D8F|nr:hypothetical protein [Pseudomonas fluorescens]MDZ5431232.1 hypothetical protein [Pseudomonas fluorescens]
MKDLYNIASIRGLLFVFDIENADDDEREALIASKDINDEKELAELFDLVLKPEFFSYEQKGRETLINTIAYFLNKNDNFDRVFERMTTYFDDVVVDQAKFMRILLECLQRYQKEGD